MTIEEFVGENALSIANMEIQTVKLLEVLIADCGTRQNSIETSSMFANSKLVAIDLSLRNLSYVTRKDAQ